MMTLDYVGDGEAMEYAQLGQQPLVRTTETSPEPERGTLSCLSARPPDLAFWTGTRPRVVGVSPSIVPFLYSKRTAAARSPGSRYYQPWNYPSWTGGRVDLVDFLNFVLSVTAAVWCVPFFGAVGFSINC